MRRIILFLSCFIWFGCATKGPRFGEVVDAAQKERVVKKGAAYQLAKLDGLTAGREGWAELVADARFLVSSAAHEEKGFIRSAAIDLQQAIKSENLFIAQYAFDRLTDLYKKEFLRVNAPQIASRLEKDIKKLSKTPFIQKRRLYEPQALRAYLEKRLAHKEKVAQKDPALCEIEPSLSQVGLSRADYEEFDEARRLLCRGSGKKALLLIKNTLAKEGAKRLSFEQKILLARHLVSLMRRGGERPMIAWAYRHFLRTYTRYLHSQDRPHPPPLEAVDIAFWAARYDGLLGFYDAATHSVNYGLQLISEIALDQSLPESQLQDYRAEGAHILAFRVHTEQRQFQKAIDITTKTLALPELSETWRRHLYWYGGLYAYLDKQYQLAKNSWQEALNLSEKGIARARALFWLARVHEQLDDRQQSEFYLEALASQFPLDFYTLVAPGLAKMRFGRPPFQLSSEPPLLHSAPLDLLESDKKLSAQRLKMEILLASGARQAAALIGRRLERDLGKQAGFSQDSQDDYLYLAKLYALSGENGRSVRIVNRLKVYVDAKEQRKGTFLNLAFPQPHKEAFKKASEATSVPLAILYAIGLQESSFEAKAQSPARAFGLMQLILPTARRFAGEDVSRRDLFTPQKNLAIGGRYLKFLDGYFTSQRHLVYSAYNAGEFATQRWQQRRNFGDLLVSIEAVPFSETKRYLQNVWRNNLVYEAALIGPEEGKAAGGVNP